MWRFVKIITSSFNFYSHFQKWSIIAYWELHNIKDKPLIVLIQFKFANCMMTYIVTLTYHITISFCSIVLFSIFSYYDTWWKLIKSNTFRLTFSYLPGDNITKCPLNENDIKSWFLLFPFPIFLSSFFLLRIIFIQWKFQV